MPLENVTAILVRVSSQCLCSQSVNRQCLQGAWESGCARMLRRTSGNGNQSPTHLKFSRTAFNWSVLKEEPYVVVFCLQKLDYYLRMNAFVVDLDSKLIRRKLFIHCFTLRHIPGRLNTVADALSRLYHLTIRMLDEAQLGKGKP